MKTILRIIIILSIAVLVAGSFFVALKDSSMLSAESGEPPLMTTSDGATVQPMQRPEGGEHEASIAGGISGLLVTIVKLTGIALFVLMLEKAFSLLHIRKLISVQR